MAKRLSIWLQRARSRWPRSYRHGLMYGDGAYAVLSCTFRDGEDHIRYSQVRLCETLALAQELKAALDAKSCRAGGQCNKHHLLVDLSRMQTVSEIAQKSESELEPDDTLSFWEEKMGVDGL
jgi:hypothetical protein